MREMSELTMSTKPLINGGKDNGHYSDRGVQPVEFAQECDNENNDLQRTDTRLTITQEEFAKMSKDFGSLRRLFLVLAFLTISLICVCSFLVIHQQSENARNKVASVSNPVISAEEINKVLQESRASNHSLTSVQKHIFCDSCDVLRDVEPYFFEVVGNKCCIANISMLVRLLQYQLFTNLNEFRSKVTSLQLSIEDLKDDTNILENALFMSNRTNVKDGSGEGDGIPKESVLWAMIQKNNKLINSMLNRKRSVLHLSGTADATSIRWTEEMQSGDLSYDMHGIHVRSGGKYFIYCNIHFSKKDCNGTENFEYSINEEYSPGEFLPFGHVQKGCASGSSVDTGLLLQRVLQVGLGQQTTIRIQYNKISHDVIAKENRLHNIIIFEI